MRYLPEFAVSALLMIVVAGCHRRQAHVVTPPQVQAPSIVTTLPPMPLLTLPDVELAKSKPPVPTPPPATPAKQPAKKVARKRPHHVRKPDEEKAEPAAEDSTPASAPADNSQSGATAVKAPVLGQLSTDDSATDPDAKKDTHGLIQDTENRLKKLSNSLRAAHKNDIAQIESFLKQAEQAWSTNDVVGAQTLANKAKILLDDLSK